MAERERRHRGEGSVYQRESDSRWIGVVDLGWVGGKRVRKTVSAKTLRELRPKLKALKARIEQGVITDDSNVAQWIDHWMAEIAPKKVRPRTLSGYQSYVDTWIKPNLGRVRLRDVRPEHVRALHRAMADAGKSDATQRQAHMILQRALKVAEQEGKIVRNPCSLVDAPKVGTAHHAALELEDARRLAVWADSQDARTRARIGAALFMGLRQGEALGLRWDDVAIDEGVATIRQSATRVRGKGLIVGDVKSIASNRDVPMIPAVRQAFRDWREGASGEFVFGGDVPSDPRADWQLWKDSLKAAGCPDVPLHGARASCASILDSMGVSARVIADILGHAQVTTTQKHYARSYAGQRREVMEAMGRLVLGSAESDIGMTPEAITPTITAGTYESGVGNGEQGE